MTAPLAVSAPAPVRLDVSGETCPVPLIEARKALRAVPVGARVEIVGTHDSSYAEIPLLVRNLGHALVAAEGSAKSWRFVIERRQ